MACKDLFLGRDGLESSVYVSTLARTGSKEKALIAYLDDMAPYVTTKFQNVVLSTQELYEAGEQFKKGFVDKGDKNDTHIGVTAAILRKLVYNVDGNLSKEDTKKAVKSDSDEIQDIGSEKVAKEQLFKDLRRLPENKDKTHETIRNEVESAFEQDPDLFEKYKDEVKKKWTERQNKQGSTFHLAIETALKKYIEKENSGEVGEYINLRSLVKESLDYLNIPANRSSKENQNTGLSSSDPFVLNKHTGKGSFSPEMSDAAVDKLQEILDIREKLSASAGRKVEMYAEFLVDSDNLTIRTEGTIKKLAGIADIVFINPDTKEVNIYEMKTKSETSMQNMNSAFGNNMHHGVQLRDTPMGKAKAQVSVMAEVFREKGYTVGECGVIMTAAELTTNGSMDDVGNREFYYTKKARRYNDGKVDTVTFFPSDITAAFTTDYRAPNKGHITDTLSDITDGSFEMVFDDSTEYVENKKKDVITLYDAAGNVRGYQWTANQRAMETGKSGLVQTKTMEAMEKHIINDFKLFAESKKRIAVHLRDMFETGEPPKVAMFTSGQVYKLAEQVLKGFSSKTHNCMLPSDLGLVGVDDTCLIMVDKATKEASVVSLLPLMNVNKMNSSDSNVSKRNFLGKYISDAAYKARYGSNMIEGDTKTLEMLRLGMVAADIMKNQPYGISGIQYIKTACAYSSTASTSNATMNEVLAMCKRIQTVSGDRCPKSISEILTDPRLSKAKTYIKPGFDVFYDILLSSDNPENMFRDMSKNSYFKKLRKDIKDTKSKNVEGSQNYELIKQLRELAKMTKNFISTNEVGKSNTATDPRIRRIYKAVEDLANMDLQVQHKGDIAFHSSLINNQTTIGGKHASEANRAINVANQKLRDQMQDFIEQNEELADAAAEEMGLGGLDGRLMWDGSSAFMDKLVMDSKFTKGNEENWMRMWDENDPNNPLGPKGRAYVEFINKYIEEAMEISLSTKDNRIRKDKDSAWKKGYLPVMRATDKTAIKDAVMNENKGVSDVIEAIYNSVKPTSKVALEESVEDIEAIESKVARDQFDRMGGVQASPSRRRLLGIDERGKQLEDTQRNVETNPFIIMNRLMLDSYGVEHKKIAAFKYVIIDADLENAGYIYGDDMKNTRLQGLIKNTTKMSLLDEYEKETSKFAKYGDMAGQMASSTLFWGSLRQMSTEVSTVLANSASDVFSANLSKVLFGNESSPRYSGSDWLWAAKQKKLADQIGDQLGVYSADPKMFMNDAYVKGRKKGLWKTEHGYAVQALAIKSGCEITFLAEMKKQGIDQAYVQYDDSKPFVYMEEKDPRFYVYDPDQKLGFGNTTPPKTDKDIAKYAMWKAHRKALMEEGGIRDMKLGNRDKKELRMFRPFTSKEQQSMKYHVVRRFGTLDAEGNIAMEYYACGRMAAKFKRWMVQKTDTYWHEREESSSLFGKWVYNEDPNIPPEWVGQPMEGICQTLTTLFRRAKDGSMKWNEGWDQMQQDNIAKFLADLLTLGLIAGALYGISQTDIVEDSPYAKEAVQGLRNVTADVIPVAGLWTSVDNGPFAILSMCKRIAESGVKTISYSATGDYGKGAAYFASLMRFAGSTRATATGWSDDFVTSAKEYELRQKDQEAYERAVAARHKRELEEERGNESE